MAETYECFKVDVADFVATVRLVPPAGERAEPPLPRRDHRDLRRAE